MATMPSLLYTLIGLAALSRADSTHYREQLGELGKNYNNKNGKPYIQCEGWNETTRTSSVETCEQSGDRYQFGKKMGCYNVFKVLHPEKYVGMEESGHVLQPHEYERQSNTGCWLGEQAVHTQCAKESRCLATIRAPSDKGLFAFCCCTVHDCNKNVTVKFPGNGTDPYDEEIFSNSTSPMPRVEDAPSSPFWILFWICLAVLLFLGLCCCCCRLTRAKYWMRLLTGDQKVFDVQTKPDEVPLVKIETVVQRNTLKDELTRGEIMTKGKMSTVLRGTYKDPDTGKERPVVLKTIEDRKSFILEESAYMVCANSHDHIAHFLGSSFEPDTKSSYIVMEYYENGSLEEYLKNETFTPSDALAFLTSLMDGLAFLHTPSTLPNGGYKSAIVHRDIKSRNVLVKSDRSAAICDFGLAMVCEGNRPYGNRHYQVGTHRYMSPELLASIANLNMDGLKMADVYAVSLIIWEILNRTVIDEEDGVRPAELPYATEVDAAVAEDEAAFLANNPNDKFQAKKIEYYLKPIVHRDNRRPVLRERLKENPITAVLATTTLDMWHMEVDGRISAACAHARLIKLSKDAINGTIQRFS